MIVVEALAGERHEHVLQRRLLAVVPGDHGRQLRRGSLGDDPAVVDQRDPVAQPLGLVQVVRRQHDRGVVRVAHLLDEGLHVELRPRVETRRRLVQQQHRRAGQQRSRDRDLLLHPAAHLLERPAQPLLADAEARHDLDRLRTRLPGVQAVEPRRIGEVLVRGELLEEGGVDAHAVDELLDLHLVALDVVTEHLDPAPVQRQQRADEADEGGLARSVRAEDPVDLAAANRQRHLVDGDDRLLLATDHERFVARSMSSAGCSPAGGGPTWRSGCRTGATVAVVFGSSMTSIIVVSVPFVPGPENRRAAARCSRSAALVLPVGASKNREPDPAHGSWCLRRRSYRRCSTSSRAQISRRLRCR